VNNAIINTAYHLRHVTMLIELDLHLNWVLGSDSVAIFVEHGCSVKSLGLTLEEGIPCVGFTHTDDLF